MANSGPGWEAIDNAWWHLNSEAIQQQRWQQLEDQRDAQDQPLPVEDPSP